MSRTVTVSRVNDPQAPNGLSIRIDVDSDTAEVKTLSLTPEEAIELHAILGLFNFNQWISSVTGSAAPPIIPAEWRDDSRKGGAS